ncbi:MAG: RNA methyltransferase [Gemella sp.]|nr:RNA methyltransferase [Gemella sp.]
MIYSTNNPRIKNISKLKDIKNIKKQQKYIIEGLHLLEEAINSKVVELIIKSESFDKNINFDISGIEVITIDEKATKLLSDTVTSQGIFAICKIEEKELDISKYNNILVLDKIQDPGNLGTIVRTADAFNFDAIILSKGTTSLYAPKVMRSMQGSNFHINCFDNIDLPLFLDSLQNFDILATSLDTNESLEDIQTIKSKCAIILGNEANGVSTETLNKVNRKVKINMPGQAESLNVAVAAGIMMHYIKNILK